MFRGGFMPFGFKLGKENTTVLSVKQVTPENAVEEFYREAAAEILETAKAQEKIVADALAKKAAEKRAAEAQAANLLARQAEEARMAAIEENPVGGDLPMGFGGIFRKLSRRGQIAAIETAENDKKTQLKGK
jgi:hypothetical protein